MSARSWISRHWAGVLAGLVLVWLLATEGREILHTGSVLLHDAATGEGAAREACFDRGGAWDHAADICLGALPAAGSGRDHTAGTG